MRRRVLVGMAVGLAAVLTASAGAAQIHLGGSSSDSGMMAAPPPPPPPPPLPQASIRAAPGSPEPNEATRHLRKQARIIDIQMEHLSEQRGL